MGRSCQSVATLTPLLTRAQDTKSESLLRELFIPMLRADLGMQLDIEIRVPRTRRRRSINLGFWAQPEKLPELNQHSVLRASPKKCSLKYVVELNHLRFLAGYRRSVLPAPPDLQYRSIHCSGGHSATRQCPHSSPYLAGLWAADLPCNLLWRGRGRRTSPSALT
jgi:hypothetical protein